MPYAKGDIQIRIPKTITKGKIVTGKARIIHPMETGFRKDKDTGITFPSDYINDVKVYYGDTLISHFDWTYGVSKDPFLTFSIRADKEAPLKIIWQDNKGGTGEKAVRIVPH